jgi:RNA polymerase nonessential primary-like sigma factor
MAKSPDSDNSSFNDFSELADLNNQALDADELKEV